MRKDPLIIRLTDIPEEGKSFTFSQKDPTAALRLHDLLGDHPFLIEASIRPLNHQNFELTGRVQAASAQQCSRCAEDFEFNLHQKINEIMIPTLEVGRTERYAKTPTDDSSDLSSVQYSTDMTFDLGEYVHEIIALNTPENPAPAVKGDQCSGCPRKVVPGAFDYDETTPSEIRPSPFEVLKNLKV